MNERMHYFLLELAMSGGKVAINPARRSITESFNPFNPYHQWPKHKPSGLSSMDKRFIKEHGTGYRLMPEHSRPGAPIIAGAIVKSPLFISTFGVAALAIGLSYLSGDEPNYPWSPRKQRVMNNPTQLYLS
jgi:hypothetical protein